MENVTDIKETLLQKLKNERVFWSYNPSSITEDTVTDDVLIEKTLIYLDIEDIDLLFLHFKPKFVKKVWREKMACQGNYLLTLNRFLAWYFFKIKNPDEYLKRIENKHFKSYG